MQLRLIAPFGLVLALASACGGTLHPAAVASSPPGPGAIAVGFDAGVRLKVRTDVEHPRELPEPVTALYVRIENDSGRDLVVRPSSFALIGANGLWSGAIRPDALRRSEDSPPSTDVAIAMRALRTDVLGKGGQADGFVYFDNVAAGESVTLRFELRAEDTGTRFGLITVPLTRG